MLHSFVYTECSRTDFINISGFGLLKGERSEIGNMCRQRLLHTAIGVGTEAGKLDNPLL